jgi:anti-sigma factor ChrR (cupin superfamily)
MRQAAVRRSVAQSEALEREVNAMIDREATNMLQEAFDHLFRMIDASEPGLAKRAATMSSRA